ncbi:hypothetical protein [Paenibacillus sp. OV219]|uniref:hypothetical protein n=1 Tax=Paenibacillus sp. OV219 TaxID=1884377 RepID=UPI0008C7701E|nr:hypothetical protein [Paenibacillus sp. OV219]SEN23724.1 hypothetical protein SAMN05518847_102486 [Paenibacillus sp. OV219]
MSRVEKFGRRNAVPEQARSKNKKATKQRAVNEQENKELSSRREAHPSNKQQMTKWFFRFVIGLFVLLMIGLLLWGRQYS